MRAMVMMLMTEPNTRLRAARLALHMSQSDFARAVREAGLRTGEPNGCSASQVRRWESGTTAAPHPRYLRALEMATGQPAENLGFRADERYGLDAEALGVSPGARFPDAAPHSAVAPLNGIWVSRYEYESSGRGSWFKNAHYVLVIQQGSRIQVRSLPGTTTGRMLMDLTINGAAVTGTWTEETNPEGYYQGSVYHGAIQMLLEPSGRKMAGQWAGFGRDYDVNTGPWSLELLTHDTSPETQAEYSRIVDDGPVPIEDAERGKSTR
jgi:transcriptional regulator with XRE-family HTH domain